MSKEERSYQYRFAREELERKVAEFCSGMSAEFRNYYLTEFPVIAADPGRIPRLTAMWGERYVRLVKETPCISERSAFAFVDVASGDILMTAGWKAPFKGKSAVRGNLFDPCGGRSAVDLNGVRRAERGRDY